MKNMIVFLSILVLTVGCEKIKDEVIQLEESKPGKRNEALIGIKKVRGFTVKEGQAPLDHHEVLGTIAPAKEVALSFGMPGKITEINIKEGQRVKKGDVLASLDLAFLEQDVRSLEANLKRAQVVKQKLGKGASLEDKQKQQIVLQKARLDLEQSTSEWTKTKTLYENGAISKAEYEQKQYEHQRLELAVKDADIVYQSLLKGTDSTDLTAADIEISQATAQLEAAKQEADHARIIAPFSGIVSKVQGRESEHVGTGQEVIRIIDETQQVVHFQVNPHEIEQWKMGAPLNIRSENKIFQGIITAISPVINEEMTSISIDASLKTASASEIPAGATVGVSQINDNQAGIWIPVSSVGIIGDERYVMKLEGNKVKKHLILVDTITDNQYHVLEGLTSGDVIVENGIYYILDGERIEVVKDE